jgi:transcriptional regulator with XRE-family HTH domain
MRLCKDFAKEKKNLSVERIADLMGVSSDNLYAWLGNGKMHLALIPTYEHICGCNFISDHLVHSQGKLAVKIPSGRDMQDKDLMAIHKSFSKTMTLLAEFYSEKADAVETLNAITEHMQAAAWHRGNVQKHLQPEFDFESE